MSNEAEIKHYLGVDYGQAKIGLARADSETRIAFAYGKLENNKEVFQKLAEIIKKEDISIVVVGVPSYINTEEVEYPSEDFGYMLKNLVPEVEIEFTNEMFSTKIAQANLKERGGKNIQKLDDQEAARVILQGWLDNGRKSQTQIPMSKKSPNPNGQN